MFAGLPPPQKCFPVKFVSSFHSVPYKIKILRIALLNMLRKIHLRRKILNCPKRKTKQSNTHELNSITYFSQLLRVQLDEKTHY